ncbi:MAG: hypothetical protein LBR80_10265 [Deltaproteobacteria bacterium]|nr:hypothetical protein [Deltaproteobacteria bacterium]
MSPCNVYSESGTGVAAGGRTGFAAMTVAALFALSLLLSRLFLLVPSAAVMPALTMAGLLMTSSLARLDFGGIAESFPAFAMIVIVGFTLRLTDGLAVGWTLFIVMKLVSGRRKELPHTVWAVGALFLAKEITGI